MMDSRKVGQKKGRKEGRIGGSRTEKEGRKD